MGVRADFLRGVLGPPVSTMILIEFVISTDGVSEMGGMEDMMNKSGIHEWNGAYEWGWGNGTNWRSALEMKGTILS